MFLYEKRKSFTQSSLAGFFSLKFMGHMFTHAQLLQSCPAFCNPVDCSLPGSFVHEILGKNTEGFPCPPPEDFSNPGIEPGSSALQAGSLLLSHQGSPYGP